jgi:hypothetical protein
MAMTTGVTADFIAAPHGSRATRGIRAGPVLRIIVAVVIVLVPRAIIITLVVLSEVAVVIIRIIFVLVRRLGGSRLGSGLTAGRRWTKKSGQTPTPGRWRGRRLVGLAGEGSAQHGENDPGSHLEVGSIAIERNDATDNTAGGDHVITDLHGRYLLAGTALPLLLRPKEQEIEEPDDQEDREEGEPPA